MEEQKRRAEADKLAAITALEARSREFMREKEEKRRLEARIATMQSQLLIGGSKLEDTPVFRCAAAPACHNETLNPPLGTVLRMHGGSKLEDTPVFRWVHVRPHACPPPWAPNPAPAGSPWGTAVSPTTCLCSGWLPRSPLLACVHAPPLGAPPCLNATAAGALGHARGHCGKK